MLTALLLWLDALLMLPVSNNHYTHVRTCAHCISICVCVCVYVYITDIGLDSLSISKEMNSFPRDNLMHCHNVCLVKKSKFLH